MSMFSWCYSGDHQNCHREYQRFIVDPKQNSVVMLDEMRYCQCTSRSCPCFKNPKKDTSET